MPGIIQICYLLSVSDFGKLPSYASIYHSMDSAKINFTMIMIMMMTMIMMMMMVTIMIMVIIIMKTMTMIMMMKMMMAMAMMTMMIIVIMIMIMMLMMLMIMIAMMMMNKKLAIFVFLHSSPLHYWEQWILHRKQINSLQFVPKNSYHSEQYFLLLSIFLLATSST